MKQLIIVFLATILNASSTLLAAPPEKDEFILASKLSWSAEDAPLVELKILKESSIVGGPPAVFKSGKWKYTFRASNRHHSSGTLEYNGLVVKPDKIGQIIITPFGKLRFFSLTEKHHMSGWFSLLKKKKEQEPNKPDASDGK